MSTYSVASELDFFNECLDELAVELVRNDLGVESHGHNLSDFQGIPVGSVDDEKLNKSAWVASLLASSDKDEHRRKALAYGVLSYIRKQDTEQKDIYQRYLYIILSRLGNLPAFENVDPTETELSFAEQLVQSLDSILRTELVATREEYEIESGPTLSKFQKDIYNNLTAGRDVAISGPTSSGKSFILQQYIEEKVDEDEHFEAIYVVPTRALISEVSRDLADLEGVSVRTGAYFDEEDEKEMGDTPDEDVFLVVTPERCRKLIDPDVRTRINPDLVFFDEVQNVEDDERGVLFEGIVQLLNDFYPSAQIVAAGPYLDNPGETLESLTSNEVAEVQSAFTPVLQLKVSLQFRKGRDQDISAKVHSPSGNTKRIDITEPDGLSFTQVKSNKTRSLPIILDQFARNSKTLVYSGQKNYAEKRARYIAEGNESQTLSPELEQLKDFLSEAIHSDYSLIECLEKGVAFHHGNVPKFAREEIENIYKNTGDLQTIVTTPTLMQGVNLPAEKIFLVGAKRGNQELTDFEFNNLIGRVGRVDTKLYGAIYCIETEEDEWADDKLEKAGEKEVKPATTQAIDEAEKLINALRSTDLSTVEDPSVKYTAILLRGRYLKDDKDVSEYLEKKGMDSSDIKSVKLALDQTLGEVDLPEKILKKNPTVDPVKLDILYKSVTQNPDQWILGEDRFYDIYDDLLTVSRNLNKVFKFTNDEEADIDPKHVETEYGALEPIIVNATQWLQGRSYQDMIESRRETDSVPDDEDIDKSIREVMKIVDNDICFLLVKYFGILTTILEEVYDETPEWMLHFDRMLEMGSMNFAELKLMSQGVDRSVAVDLNIPPQVTDPVEYLRENPQVVPNFHEQHLKRQDIL